MSTHARAQAPTQILFPLGALVATPGALARLAEVGATALQLIARHGRGDWGELSPEDRQANAAALKNGWRILSAYRIQAVRFWVITEADRSVTTVLLPEEY